MSTGYEVPIPPRVAADATVAAKTGDGTLAASDMEKNITNTGAAGTITLTLPAASGVAGRGFNVQVTAAQIVRLDPNGTEKIFLGGDGVAGKYLQVAGVIGNYAQVYCDGVNWFCRDYAGVVTKEA